MMAVLVIDRDVFSTVPLYILADGVFSSRLTQRQYQAKPPAFERT
jgi:hypothetical protein